MSFKLWARYLRVSSEEQALPGTSSISTQDTDTAALVAREGGVLVDTYCDDKRYRVGGRLVEPSGERSDRPEWQRLLADIRSGRVNAVVAWHASRLYRNYRPAIDFLELIDEYDVTVRLVTDSFDKRFAMLQAWAAREENKSRVDRIQMGRQGKARQGFAATRHPKFYHTLRDETGKRIGCELRPEYQPFFDKLAALFLARQSYDRIAATLGRNPVTGTKLSGRSISEIMGNPWFRGLIDYGRSARKRNTPRFTAPGKHPAAWPPATISAIARELERRAVMSRSIAHHGRGKLAGLLRCGYCGCLLTPLRRVKGEKIHTYYRCWAIYNLKRRGGTNPGPGLPHLPNNISEREALQLIGERVTRQTDAEIKAAYAAYHTLVPPPVPPAAPNGDELARVATELDALPASAIRARALLAAEVDRLQAEYEADTIAYEQAQSAAPVVDLAAVLAAVAELRALGDLSAVPDDVLRPALLEAYEAVYIRAKRISERPRFG